MSIEKTISAYMSGDRNNERCGIVIEKSTGLIFKPCENIHPYPKEAFLINSREIIKASINGKIHAIVHSHVNGNNKLSSVDRCVQYINRYDYWLFCDGELTKHKPIDKLKGRVFNEGYVDCYDSFRDFYYLCGVDMKKYSPDDGYRIPDWHRKEGAKSPFIENLSKEGFYMIEGFNEMKEGDVIISLLGSNIPNHSLVYVGNNEVFHHLPERLSGVEVLRDYFIKMKHSIWRHKDSENLPISDVINLLKSEVTIHG